MTTLAKCKNLNPLLNLSSPNIKQLLSCPAARQTRKSHHLSLSRPTPSWHPLRQTRNLFRCATTTRLMDSAILEQAANTHMENSSTWWALVLPNPPRMRNTSRRTAGCSTKKSTAFLVTDVTSDTTSALLTRSTDTSTWSTAQPSGWLLKSFWKIAECNLMVKISN